MAGDVPKDYHDGDTQRKEKRMGTLEVSVIFSGNFSHSFSGKFRTCLLSRHSNKDTEEGLFSYSPSADIVTMNANCQTHIRDYVFDERPWLGSIVFALLVFSHSRGLMSRSHFSPPISLSAMSGMRIHFNLFCLLLWQSYMNVVLLYLEVAFMNDNHETFFSCYPLPKFQILYLHVLQFTCI